MTLRHGRLKWSRILWAGLPDRMNKKERRKLPAGTVISIISGTYQARLYNDDGFVQVIAGDDIGWISYSPFTHTSLIEDLTDPG